MCLSLCCSGRVDINVLGENGRTPLHMAAIGGYIAIAERLIKEGAHVTPRDANDRTPYDVAGSKGHKRVRMCMCVCIHHLIYIYMCNIKTLGV